MITERAASGGAALLISSFGSNKLRGYSSFTLASAQLRGA
jgi:hypothetical protein